MFDPMYDQAAGLRSVVTQVGIKLVPVVLARDADTAFDLVWMLGAGLSTLGRTVIALDATSREQPGRPGLAQQLQVKVPAAQDGGMSPWQIMPSQSGLSTLMHTAQTLGAKSAQARVVALFPLLKLSCWCWPPKSGSVCCSRSQPPARLCRSRWHPPGWWMPTVPSRCCTRLAGFSPCWCPSKATCLMRWLPKVWPCWPIPPAPIWAGHRRVGRCQRHDRAIRGTR
jgi:hypothetical protein